MKKHLILIIFSIFFVPLSGIIQLSGADVWYSQYIGLLSCFSIGLSLVLWKFNRYISIFTLLCLFSTIFGHDGTRFITSQHPRQFLILIQIYLSCGAIYVIYNFPKKYRMCIFWALLGLVVMQSILVSLQFLNIDPIFEGKGVFMLPGKVDDTVGFSASHNQIGLFYAVVSPLVLGFCPYLIPFVILGLWGSTTSIAWLAFILSSGFYGIVTKKKMLLVIVLITILLGATYILKVDKISSIAFDERLNLVSNTIKQVETGKAIMQESYVQEGTIYYTKKIRKVTCSPWLGFGIGNFQRISPHTQRHFIRFSQKHTYSHAHNDLVEIYFDIGRLGLIAVLLIIIDLVHKFIVTRKTKILTISFTCILAHFICSLGIFTVHTAMSGMLLIIMLGVFYGEVRDGTRKIGTFTQLA